MTEMTEMTEMTKEHYIELAEKVGFAKMKEIEEACGICTGLLDPDKHSEELDVKAKDSELTVNIGPIKEALLKTLKEQGCTIADLNLVKKGEPDYVLSDHKETKVHTKKIIALHEEIVGYVAKGFDVAKKIGELLISLKENHIKQGELGAWMKQNLPFSIRTGQRYMQIYLFSEELAKKEITSLTDAYLELSGEPLDGELIVADDSTNTKKKWEIESTAVEVDNLKLPKKKLKGLQKDLQITVKIVEQMEQGQCPFDAKYAKIVANVPSSEERKSMLSRFVIAANSLLVPGGKLIFVKKKQ